MILLTRQENVPHIYEKSWRFRVSLIILPSIDQSRLDLLDTVKAWSIVNTLELIEVLGLFFFYYTFLSHLFIIVSMKIQFQYRDL